MYKGYITGNIVGISYRIHNVIDEVSTLSHRPDNLVHLNYTKYIFVLLLYINTLLVLLYIVNNYHISRYLLNIYIIHYLKNIIILFIIL